ncbi:SGNH/GDSL hydrolase family protein [Rhodococcus sp. 06-1460-1B]|uniref:SGNH/GDSL hydrolase family protein n=1 Tax=Rhodococcus sp. 06-1460-1B TaxID=2022501 RepID=UPI000B9B66B6|nr:SGNH/GDSL hydrolase family protein [Rhodococcus sp. 06-1460-1B]OZD61726.1 lipase [Rhodococcus sp. 06-1460-1B]
MITTDISDTLLHGAAELERTDNGVLPHRLPRAARQRFTDPQLTMAESQPSGVRLVFTTTATIVEIEAVATRRAFLGLPPRPAGLFDLRIDGVLTERVPTTGGITTTIDMATGSVTDQVAPSGVARFSGLPATDKHVEIWLPHNEIIELVGLRTDAAVSPVVDTRPIWIDYGSSISQGSNATGPSTTWTALAAATAGVQLRNLGFGGSALLDHFVATAIRDAPADLISLEIGINLVNSDVMRLRAFTSAVHGFLDTIRDGHPHTPLFVISALLCPIHENTPGPGAFDPAALASDTVKFAATGDPAEVRAGKLTLTVIREELARIVSERATADPHLHYLDGRELYGDNDVEDYPLPDRLHPDQSTHELIAERVVDRIFPRTRS